MRRVRLGAGPDGRVAHPDVVDVQADGSLVLVTGNYGGGYQLRVMAPLERMQCLVVSFTARVRRPGRRTAVEVVATRSARARIDLFRGQRRLSAMEVDLHAGVNRVPLRVGRSGEVHVLRVRATSADGAVAAHRLPFIPGPVLSRRALSRALADLAYQRSDIEFSIVHRGCRRRSARRFVCRKVERIGTASTPRGTGSIRLRADGRLELVERQASGARPFSRELELQR